MGSARWLAENIPKAYAACPTRADHWEPYAGVFPETTHRPCAKREGETCRVENTNGILRSRLARLVRRTLSLSKGEATRELIIRWFLTEHNLRLR